LRDEKMMQGILTQEYVRETDDREGGEMDGEWKIARERRRERAGEEG
jgi:hypothetical protein